MEFEMRSISQKWFSEDTPVNYSPATATIGEGADGVVTIYKNDFTIDADDYAVSVIIPEEESELSAKIEDKTIIVSLATGDAENANATIGSGVDGTINVEVDEAGVAGNSYTIAVVEGLASGNMSADLSSTDITVTLGMTAPTSASTTIGSGTDGTVTIEVNAAGAAGNNYTVEVVNGEVYGATLIENALTITVREAGDSAESIANLINSEVGDIFTATGSGAGLIATPEAEKSFIGGLDTAPNDVANTATLIAAAINELTGITATASGEGTGSLVAEAKKSFTGGSDYGVNSAGNTASLIAEVISEIDGFTATASGEGTTAISTETSEDVDFEDGKWGTPCPEAGIALQDTDYIYVCVTANNTTLNNNWRRFTLSDY